MVSALFCLKCVIILKQLVRIAIQYTEIPINFQKGGKIMALQLMKIVIDAATTTNVNPVVAKFFYVTPAETDAGTTLTIDAADFFLDNGNPATELPELEADNSYFNVFVNGVLQMQGLSTYTPGATTVGSLAIAVPAGGEPIIEGSPIVLEVANFTPSSTVDVAT